LVNVVDALGPAVARLIYISSTSVYGQTGGVWVDEDSPCRPRTENGRIALQAEQVLAACHTLGPRAVILRLAGLYGPGRIPRRQALAAGEPIAAPSQGHLNLIHVADAVQAVLAAEQVRASGLRIYNVADGQPPQRRDYYAQLARLVGGPPPRFTDPSPDAPAARRAESDKRVSNRRMLAELGVELRHPSYREGLSAILRDQEQGPAG
jgi:nucleoside-diphosphate-sugar epimerase